MRDAPAVHLGWSRRGVVVRPYLPGDEGQFTPRADFAEELAGEGGVLPSGPKLTLTRAGRPIAVGGVERQPGPGPVYAAWALCEAGLTPAEWLLAARAARELIAWLKRERPGASVTVLLNGPTAEKQRLAERIGFRFAKEA